MAASQGAHEKGTERNPLRKVLFMLSIGLSLLCVYFCLDYQSGSSARLSGELIVGKVDTAGYGDSDSSVAGFFFEHFGVLSYLFCFAIVYVGYFLLLKPVDIWRADFYKAGLRILGFNCVLIGAAGILSRFADIGSTGAGGLLGDMLNIFFDLFVPSIVTVLTFGLVMVCGIAFMSGSTPFALFERVGELFFKVVPSGSEKSKKRTPITDTDNVSLDPALTGAGTVAALSAGAAMAADAHASDELSDIVADEELEDLYDDAQADPNAMAASEQDLMQDETALSPEYDSDPDEIDTSKYDFSNSMQEGAQGGVEPVFGDDIMNQAPSAANLDPSFAEQGDAPDFFAGVMSTLNSDQAPQADLQGSASDTYAGDLDQDYADANGQDYVDGSDHAYAGESDQAYADGADAAYINGAAPAYLDSAEQGYADGAEPAYDANGQQYQAQAGAAYAQAGADYAQGEDGQYQYGADGQYEQQAASEVTEPAAAAAYEAAPDNAYAQGQDSAAMQSYAEDEVVPPMPIPGDSAESMTAEQDGFATASAQNGDDIVAADDLAKAVSAVDEHAQEQEQDAVASLARMAAGESEDDLSADSIAGAVAQSAQDNLADSAASVGGAAAAAAAGAVAATGAASASTMAAGASAPPAVNAALSGLTSAVKGALAAGAAPAAAMAADDKSSAAKADDAQEHEMTNEEREALNESLRKVVLVDVTKVKSSGDPYAIAHDRLKAKEQAEAAAVEPTQVAQSSAKTEDAAAAAAEVAADEAVADASDAVAAQYEHDEDSPYGYATYASKHGLDKSKTDKSSAKTKEADDAEAAQEDDGAVHTIVQRIDPKVFAAQLEAQKKAREEKERLEREKAEQENLEAEKAAAAEAEAKEKAEQDAAAAEALAEKQALDEAIAAEQQKDDGPRYAGTFADDMDKAAADDKDEGPKYITPGVGDEDVSKADKKEGPGTIIRDTRKEFEAAQAARAAAKAEQERLEKERIAKEAQEAEEAEKAAAEAEMAAAEKAAQDDADVKASEDSKAEEANAEDAKAESEDATKAGEPEEPKGISTVITRSVAQPTAAAATSAAAAALATAPAEAGQMTKGASEQSEALKALASLASEIDSATAGVKRAHEADDAASAAANDASHESANDSVSAANDDAADTSDESFAPEHAYDFGDGHEVGAVNVDLSNTTDSDEDDFSEFVSGHVQKSPRSGFDFSRFDKADKASSDHIFSEENDADQIVADEDSSSGDDNIISFDKVKGFEVGGLSSAFIPLPGEESAKVRHSLKADDEAAKAVEAAKAAKAAEAARLAAEQAAAEAAARAAAEQEAARLAAEQEAARIAAEQESARVAAEQEAARLAAEQEAARLAAEQQAAAQRAAYNQMPEGLPAFGQEQPIDDPAFGSMRDSHRADITRGFNFNQFDEADDVEIEDSFGSTDSSDVFNHSGEDSLFGKFDVEDDFGSDVASQNHRQAGFGAEQQHAAGFGAQSTDSYGQNHDVSAYAQEQQSGQYAAQAQASKQELADLNSYISSEDEDDIYDVEDEVEDESDEQDDYAEDEGYEDDSYQQQSQQQQNMMANYQNMGNMPMQQMQGMAQNAMQMQQMPGMAPNATMPGAQIMQLPNGQYVQVMPNGMMYPANGHGMMPNMNAMGQMGVNPMGQYMQLPNGQFVQMMPNGMPMMPGAVNQMGMMQNNPMQQGMQQGMMYGNNMGMNPQVNAMQPNAQQDMQQYAQAESHAQEQPSAARYEQEQAAAPAVDQTHADAHESAADASSGVAAAAAVAGAGAAAAHEAQGVGVNGYQGNNMSEAGNAFMGAHNSSSSNLPSYMSGVAQAPAQASFEESGSKAMCTVPRHRYDSWRPSLDLLAKSGSKVEVPEEELEKTAERINEVLASYGVKAQVADYLTGPVITRFDLELAPGVKSSAISSIETELCRNLLVPNVRVVPIIDGSSYVGLEVPNHQRQFITLADMASSREFEETKAVLPMCLGASVVGNPVVKDMAESPHLLVAGTTGSGKSAGLNTMLISMLLKRSPAELRLILVDPKQLEFSIYKDLPHLITPVITDVAEKTPIALNWCVDEMERRFKLMSLLGVRKLAEYNDLIRDEAAQGRSIPDPLWTAEMGGHPTGLEPLPWIVVVVEEFADLMAQSGRKKDKEGTPESLIARLSAKSRAAGIHLVLVTQTPRSEVVTGMIKANFPSRVAFTVQNRIDSTIVLDEKGAECLLGNGDMLYKFTGSSTATRAHGAFTSNDDVKAVVDAWREYAGAPEYLEDVIAVPEEPVEESADEKPQKLDEKFDKAVELVRELGKAPTVSDLQSCLSIGYPRAKKLLRQLVLEGIID